jgi:hypothetical protein
MTKTRMSRCSHRRSPVCLFHASTLHLRIWTRGAAAFFPVLESPPPFPHYPLEVLTVQVSRAWAAGLSLQALYIANKPARTSHRLLQGGSSTSLLQPLPRHRIQVFGCSQHHLFVLPSLLHHSGLLSHLPSLL